MSATGSRTIALADVNDLIDAIAAVYDLPPAGPLAWAERQALLAARAQHVRGLLGCRRRTSADVRTLAQAIRRLDAEPDLAVRYEVREVRR
ncbi:hypothetical protein ACFXKD_16580 [Nocardiopsis aegyptia]|uniref:hypothetical protein n=1 Tax=Nocardiopsis aegyptia TaxID=220378 RepID=UPI00366ADCEF